MEGAQRTDRPLRVQQLLRRMVPAGRDELRPSRPQPSLGGIVERGQRDRRPVRRQRTDTLRKLLAVFHTEDPTRLVTAGCDNIASEPARNTAAGVSGAARRGGLQLRGPLARPQREVLQIDRQAFPQRRFIGTESGSMGGVRGDYRAPPEAGTSTSSSCGSSSELTTTWPATSCGPASITWARRTGRERLLRWGHRYVRLPQDGFYFYQSQWTDKPVLHPFRTGTGRGTIHPVTCYTNCDTVELF